MQQEIEAVVKLTFSADAELGAPALLDAVRDDVGRLLDPDSESPVELQQLSVVSIREEAAIYGTDEPAAPDYTTPAGIIKAAQGYVSNPHDWNPPTPAQVAHLLALSGISHGPIAADPDVDEAEGKEIAKNSLTPQIASDEWWRGGDPKHVEEWQRQVSENETRLGFWDWLPDYLEELEEEG